MAWIGNIPKDHVVMHPDTFCTLDDEGCHRNWVEDLSVGTKRYNSQCWQDNRDPKYRKRCGNLKRVRNITDGNILSCATEAVEYYGLHLGDLSRVLNKKRKTVLGMKFEYV